MSPTVPTTTVPTRREAAQAAHDRVWRRGGGGQWSSSQLGALGITWGELHAMQDEGLVRFLRWLDPLPGSDRVITLWLVLFP